MRMASSGSPGPPSLGGSVPFSGPRRSCSYVDVSSSASSGRLNGLSRIFNYFSRILPAALGSLVHSEGNSTSPVVGYCSANRDRAWRPPRTLRR
jgi:hypothetical protein